VEYGYTGRNLNIVSSKRTPFITHSMRKSFTQLLHGFNGYMVHETGYSYRALLRNIPKVSFTCLNRP
jgi:hypothetical protein